MKVLYVLFVVIAVAAAKKNTTDCPQNSSTNCVFNKKCLNAIDSNVTLHIPDPDNCHKFYKCAGGNACLLCCPLINSEGSKRLVYNPKLQVCDWPQNVPNPVGKCDDVNPAPQPPTPTESTKTPTESTPISTKSTPTSTEPTTTTKQEPGSQDCHNNEIKLIDNKADKSCRSYYRCENGIIKGPFTCLEGHIFNPTIGYCDLPDNYPCSHSTPKPEYFD